MEAKANTQHGRFTVTAYFEINAGKLSIPYKFSVADDKNRTLVFNPIGYIVEIKCNPEYHWVLPKDIENAEECFKEAQASFLATHCRVKPDPESED